MRSPLLLGLTVAFSLAIAACAGLSSAAASRRAAALPAASATPSAHEIDRAFVSAMVLHHSAAVEMAQVEVQRGQRTEVKQLALQISGAQQGEIRELQQIARQDFSFTPSTALPSTAQQGVLMGEPILMDFSRQIDDLKSAADPDTLFLQMMIPHHAMAIVQADTQLMHGSNQRLKAISANIISSQSREIGEMEDLLPHH